MVDLTVVVLTKNEEKNMKKCVHSFQGMAKRFVVVDSYSTDSTKKLCGEIGLTLQEQGSSLDFYENRFVDQATQFNWALDHTNIETEWVMRMDADEEVMPELVEEVQDKLSGIAKPINGIILRRRVYFMGKWIKHGGRYPELLLRIFRTGTGRCEQKVMDEHLILTDGKTIEFQNDFIDNNQKNLEWWTVKHNWYSNREVLDYQMVLRNELESSIKEKGASSNQAARKRIIKNGGYYRMPIFLRAHIYFLYRYYIRLGFLDGTEGKIFHFLQAYWYRFLVDAKMYECEVKQIVMESQGALQD
ncbi:MAG: glycosyltransferase family 2 protein [Eubacteriales bacterium]